MCVHCTPPTSAPAPADALTEEQLAAARVYVWAMFEDEMTRSARARMRRSDPRIAIMERKARDAEHDRDEAFAAIWEACGYDQTLYHAALRAARNSEIDGPIPF